MVKGIIFISVTQSGWLTIAELQDSLDHLRLSVKYLVFDLEATRRENKYLRTMLETRQDGEGAD